MGNAVRKRATFAESKQALLEAGRRLLIERGVAPGLDHVTLKDAITESGVPRSTAYRIFGDDHHPLESFRSELLTFLDTAVESKVALEAVNVAMDEHAALLASGDPVQLATALRQMIRVGIAANVDATSDNVEWKMYISSLAAAGSRKNAGAAEVGLHQDSEGTYGMRWTELFIDMAALMGLKFREPMTVDQLGLTAAAAVEGVALRQSVNPDLTNIMRPTGPGGELQPWNSAAILFEGLALTWCEPDPAAEVSADLCSWLAPS